MARMSHTAHSVTIRLVLGKTHGRSIEAYWRRILFTLKNSDKESIQSTSVRPKTAAIQVSQLTLQGQKQNFNRPMLIES